MLSAWLNREIGIIIFDSGGQKYYHAALMSGPVAAHVLEDPIGFARESGEQGGQVAVAAMARLHDRLADDAGSVAYVVRGGTDANDRPLLRLEITGKLSLHCARCMVPLDYALRLETQLLLAMPGAVPADDEDPESPEWIEAGPQLELRELVEDEILLGLPLSVRHDQGSCSNGGRVEGDARSKDSPFARLATLLQPEQPNKR